MSDVGMVLTIMSIIFTIGAFFLYKNTPKPNKH
jgi:hypothetical protein